MLTVLGIILLFILGAAILSALIAVYLVNLHR